MENKILKLRGPNGKKSMFTETKSTEQKITAF